MARPAASYSNTILKTYMLNFMAYNELPSKMENLIYGSSRLGHSNPSSPNAIFRALQSITDVNYAAVEEFVNRKGRAFGDPDFSRSHTYAFYNRVKAAKNAIEHYYFDEIAKEIG